MKGIQLRFYILNKCYAVGLRANLNLLHFSVVTALQLCGAEFCAFYRILCFMLLIYNIYNIIYNSAVCFNSIWFHFTLTVHTVLCTDKDAATQQITVSHLIQNSALLVYNTDQQHCLFIACLVI